MPDTQNPKIVALIGHPGVGKTTLHAALTAQAAPGLVFQDLPGTHALAPNTPAETRVYDLLLGRPTPAQGDALPTPSTQPDAVLVLVDATQLPQQLYLVSQVVDLRLPVVVAVGRLDHARKLGVTVRMEALTQQLGLPVLPVHPHQGLGIGEVVDALEARLDPAQQTKPQHWRPSIGLANAYNHLDSQWISKHLRLHPGARLIEGLRLLSTPGAAADYETHPAHGLLQRTLEEARKGMEDRQENWSLSEVLQRHQWAAQVSGMATTQGTPGSWIERGRRALAGTPEWVAWACVGLAAAVFLALALWYF